MVNAESGADTSKKVTLDNQTTSYGIFQVRPWFNLKSSFHPNTVLILFDCRSTAKIGVARDAKVASATKTAKVSPVWVHNFEDPIRRCRRVLRSPADHFREQHNISVINYCFFISFPLYGAQHSWPMILAMTLSVPSRYTRIKVSPTGRDGSTSANRNPCRTFPCVGTETGRRQVGQLENCGWLNANVWDGTYIAQLIDGWN